MAERWKVKLKKNISHLFYEYFRHEVGEMISSALKTDESWLERHGLLVVALVMVGGFIYFSRGEVEGKDNGKKEVEDAWDTEKHDLLK